MLDKRLVAQYISYVATSLLQQCCRTGWIKLFMWGGPRQRQPRSKQPSRHVWQPASGFTASNLLSGKTNTQHAMRHSHHNLQRDYHDANTSVSDSVPATCNHSSGIAVCCGVVSSDGNGERQVLCCGASKAEGLYHALGLPAQLSGLQQTTHFMTYRQLQAQLHICIPAHLSDIGVKCHTKFCQAKSTQRKSSCVTEPFQMWRKTATAKQRQALIAHLLML